MKHGHDAVIFEIANQGRPFFYIFAFDKENVCIVSTAIRDTGQFDKPFFRQFLQTVIISFPAF